MKADGHSGEVCKMDLHNFEEKIIAWSWRGNKASLKMYVLQFYALDTWYRRCHAVTCRSITETAVL